MFVKLMTGPHVPHKEDAKVRLLHRGSIWLLCGEQRDRWGGMWGALWGAGTRSQPLAQVYAGTGRQCRCQRGWRGLSVPMGHGNVPLDGGSQLGAASNAGDGGHGATVQQERARPLSPPSPISAFHTTKQHLPLCRPAPRFTATPRGDTTERQKPPGSFSADPGLLQKLSPAPGCWLPPRSCPFPQATALLRAFLTISHLLPQIKHWFLLTISHPLPQIKHWFFLKKSRSLPKLKRWPLLPGSTAPGQAGAAGAQDLTCGGAGARALPVPRFPLPLTALGG